MFGGGPAVAAFAVEPVRPDQGFPHSGNQRRGIHRLRSLAIAKPWRGNGFGNILVDECCKDARRIGIDRVFALTYQVRFFERNGFGVVSKDLLPQRVWIVCANCPRFPDCDEVAVMRHLDAGGA